MNKEYERVELQQHVSEAVCAKFTELGAALTGDHARRLARVLMRMAARIMINHNAGPGDFLGLAMLCLQQESQTDTPAALPQSPAAHLKLMN